MCRAYRLFLPSRQEVSYQCGGSAQKESTWLTIVACIMIYKCYVNAFFSMGVPLSNRILYEA